jgi:hypothetical protein
MVASALLIAATEIKTNNALLLFSIIGTGLNISIVINAIFIGRKLPVNNN